MTHQRQRQATGSTAAMTTETGHWAAKLQGPRRFAMEPMQTPEPAPHEVRIRVKGCGVCGSDLALWQGRPWFEYPCPAGAPGHEGWGTVEATGSAVDDLPVGTTVAGLVRDAFATTSTVPRDHVAVVPDDVAAQHQDLPLEPLACSVNAEARAGIQEGDHVVIVGAGFIGITIAALAARRGAKVMAVSRRPFALALAAAHGAERLVCTGSDAPAKAAGDERVTIESAHDDDAVIEAALGWTGGALPDVVVEATGHQAPLDLATQLCRVRGRLLIAGFHQESPRSVDMQTWNWRGLDVINGHERAPEQYMQGVRSAIRHLQEGTWDLDRLITHRFPLDQIDAAFQVLHDRPADLLKAVVRS